jgi:hypothetical protein
VQAAILLVVLQYFIEGVVQKGYSEELTFKETFHPQE